MKYLPVIVLVLTSCRLFAGSTSPFEQFNKFNDLVDSGKYSEAKSLLSSRNQADLSNSVDNFEEILPFLSSLSQVIKGESRNLNIKPSDTVACMSVQGMDGGNEPVQINLEYLLENSSWQLDYAQIDYLESADQFSMAAVCPTRVVVP